MWDRQQFVLLPDHLHDSAYLAALFKPMLAKLTAKIRNHAPGGHDHEESPISDQRARNLLIAVGLLADRAAEIVRAVRSGQKQTKVIIGLWNDCAETWESVVNPPEADWGNAKHPSTFVPRLVKPRSRTGTS